MAMGTPCAPSVCSLTFYIHEKTFVGSNSRFITWTRHIDDIFGIYRGNSRQAINAMKFLERDSKLKLKVETSNTSVNFLDITIMLDSDNLIQTKVFRHEAKVPVYTHANTC